MHHVKRNLIQVLVEKQEMSDSSWNWPKDYDEVNV